MKCYNAKCEEVEFEKLVDNNYNYIAFIIHISELEDHYISFEVREVTSWDAADTNEIIETELYLHGCVKWDGCSHIYFGEAGNSGYIHICGKEGWDIHCKVMTAVYSLAADRIKEFDKGEK